ncbi:50S ribosomal protein L7/L12 [Candidatus Parcubacteria bacterium]|nr:50S ribosomal protein L7/L12 [Candidatus Parcubacteria bacterium]
MTEEKKDEKVKETKEEAPKIEEKPKEEAPKTEEKPQEKPEEPKKEVKEEKPKEEEKKDIEVPKKFKKLVEEIEQMSVLDLAELVKILEEKFGVSAAAPVAVAAGPAAGADAGEAEKSVFTVVLTAIGDKKIEVIKTVRDITEKGLKEAKDLVDAAASEPQTVKENVKKEEAEEMKKKFVEAGANVELK